MAVALEQIAGGYADCHDRSRGQVELLWKTLRMELIPSGNISHIVGRHAQAGQA